MCRTHTTHRMRAASSLTSFHMWLPHFSFLVFSNLVDLRSRARSCGDEVGQAEWAAGGARRGSGGRGDGRALQLGRHEPASVLSAAACTCQPGPTAHPCVVGQVLEAGALEIDAELSHLGSNVFTQRWHIRARRLHSAPQHRATGRGRMPRRAAGRRAVCAGASGRCRAGSNGSAHAAKRVCKVAAVSGGKGGGGGGKGSGGSSSGARLQAAAHGNAQELWEQKGRQQKARARNSARALRAAGGVSVSCKLHYLTPCSD